MKGVSSIRRRKSSSDDAGEWKSHQNCRRIRSPPRSSGREEKMQELEATWNRSMRVWWLLLWRGIVGGFVFGAIIGAIAGGAAALLGGSVQDVVLFNSVLGPWSELSGRHSLFAWPFVRNTQNSGLH